MSILAAAVTLLWMSLPDGVRYGCYSTLLLIIVVAILATVLDWPAIVAGFIVLVLMNLRGGSAKKPPVRR